MYICGVKGVTYACRQSAEIKIDTTMQKKITTTEYRKTLREKIMNAAMKCFREKGIRAVRMDDIANELSISKRTLYEIYNNKEELLYEGVEREVRKSTEQLQQFAKEHDDVMQIILFFYGQKFRELGSVNPLFYTDLEKYAKVKEFLRIRHEEQSKNTRAFFDRGVEEGYFLPQLNYDIVTQLGEASMNYVMATKMYQQFSLQEIFKNFVSVLLRGYCTEKGQHILDMSL